MGAQKKFYEEWAIVATIDPIDANNADSDSDEIDMSKFSEICAVALLGVLNDSATFDLAAYAATSSGGSFSAISGKALTQVTGTGDAKQHMIHIRSDEIGANRYVKFTQANSAHSQ